MQDEYNTIANWDVYMPLAMRSRKDMPTYEAHLMHAALGIGDEVGELQDAFLRDMIGIPQADNLGNLRTAAIVECGDLLWYLALVSNTLQDMSDDTEQSEWQFVLDDLDRTPLAPTSSAAVYRNLNQMFPEKQSTGRVDNYLKLVASSCGNLVGLIKKREIYGKELLEGALIGAWAEAVIAVEAFITHCLDCSLEEVLSTNITKLHDRYPAKYSDWHANARLDVV